MQHFPLKISVIILFALSSLMAKAQDEIIEPIPYGDMEKWMVRVVEESFVIGGNTKYLYELATGDTLLDNIPYKNVDSPWGTSTVMAKVSGVTKGSITVFPEKRGDGYCARLETLMEHVKVLGLINIKVIASGTIFLGEMDEPVKDTKNPQSKLVTGIPFTKRPKSLQYDYKVVAGGKCIKATGFSKQQQLDEIDRAETSVILQHRWEDAQGNVYAKRVATGWERFEKTQQQWQNNHRLPIYYGDITKEDFFESYMGLYNGENAYYTRNSKGIMVPIQEIGWAEEKDEVTHLIVRMSSSDGGAYIGSTDNKFWIDNVSLVY